MSQVTQHGQWASRFAFIMAATGAAVGLGNIWKFPYMAGSNGGAVFVLAYLGCLFMIAVPIMIAEVLLGKIGRQNPIDTLKAISLKYHSVVPWAHVGRLGVLGLFMVLGFYSAISGWSLAYIFKALGGSFAPPVTSVQLAASWGAFINDPLALLFWHTCFMVATLGVVANGIKRGIELASNTLMPLLFVVLFGLVIYACLNGQFIEALTFLFKPDWTLMSPSLLLKAMGQAFFSLAVGAGCIMVYGAYLPSDHKVGSNIVIVAALGALVAILAGLAVFPLVFQYHLEPAAGPDLMFQVLPIAFSKMAAGGWIGAAFFTLLFFAAWTSSISMAEPLVMMLVEKSGRTRVFCSFVVGIIAWLIGIAALLSFNVWSEVRLFNRGIFDILTQFPTDFILPVGALCFAIISGWVLPKSVTEHESGMKRLGFNTWRFLIRYIAPPMIIAILIFGLMGG